jgi:hypothetical protein
VTKLTHVGMLELIEAAPEGGVRVPVDREDDDWEHNARVLDDLFAEGQVRADFPPMKDGAGAYRAYVGLRLTDRGRRRIRQGDDEGVLTPASVEDLRAVEAFVTAATRALESGALADQDPDRLADIEAHLQTLVAQSKAPRPVRRIIRWTLAAIGAVLGEMGASVAVDQLRAAIPIIP